MPRPMFGCRCVVKFLAATKTCLADLSRISAQNLQEQAPYQQKSYFKHKARSNFCYSYPLQTKKSYVPVMSSTGPVKFVTGNNVGVAVSNSVMANGFLRDSK